MTSLSAWKRFLQYNLDFGLVVLARDDLGREGSVWESHFKMIEIKFPHVTVTVISCETSLSGFVILFSCFIESGRAWQRSSLHVLLHFICFLVIPGK
jgi:hypothetical protein